MLQKLLKEPDHLLETKSDFIEIVENFLESQEEGCDALAVYFDLPNLEFPEIIINPRVNVPVKLDYYVNMYDDELKLKANSKVRIIGVSLL